MLTDHAAFTGKGSLSRYVLDINASTVKPDVLRFRGTEALSKPFSWRIEFTTSQQVQGEDVLLKYASFSMRGCKVVHGIITGLEWLSSTADQLHYAVTLESRLALLSCSRRCAIYQNLSVPEVVEQVLRHHGLEGADFDFKLSRDYPVRELITQWRETDLQFIRRILSEVGIWFRQEMNDVTELDVTVFGDSQLHYIFNGSLPYHEPSGLYDGAELCCWGVRTWHKVVTGKVSTRHYNHRIAQEPMDATVSVRSPAVTTGEHYRYTEPYLEAGEDTDPEPASESGAFYARIRHERELNKSAYLHLFSNAYWLSPGMVIDPAGANLDDVKNGVIIAFVSYRGSRDTRLYVSVWGMPYREEYCFRPTEISRPEVHGTIPGRVESREKNDPYAHLDESGRYRVRMDFNLEECEPGFAYPWLRMMKPVAGDNYGWHMPLVAGTEVGVAFHYGDPDRPYIAHAFHDSEHVDVVYRDNHSQNILRTAGGNTLRMEDLRGEEHIALTTPYGASQLNQGHITDEQGKQRGSGFELRTDEYGVIRVSKGLLVTADGQTKAAGDVLDMDTALHEIELCQQQIKALSLAAAQVQALEADIASQQAMFAERFRDLHEMIHFHGPEGVAFTSGEHMQLAAAGNIAMNAGGDISSGSVGNTTLLAGESLGMFAHTGKLSLISGEGPVQVQAQNGAMHISAEQRLSIASMSEILFQGKKRITLIGGGSYLKIEAGKIEYGTMGTYTRKVKRFGLCAPAVMPLDLPAMGNALKQFISIASGKDGEAKSTPVFKFMPEEDE
ncbi:type VI secretion system Vgr family protein [Shimwellia blattae]|uniref:VGR-related protein n=1 Tax=Shimwellia blattae (strain ATCC 29907 / DSM 4481 / JCM 1650 / NBRC 105725 / CDC 9005-74) TaxID=630626 RepID=I2BDR5_SHIBC|nr:type VI secretion system Vgr family protein [Shimwellia blattae]AFJ48669.1 VGR-related protein [Shimwellia blattae DSM 4481 = NBRC 105725]GAB81296.1 hypothetical protein EB105725_13_00320 [Shimwellia blattae DSM 4481 = NBRC 105725]VDY66158.1 Uncharacterized protein conserved in bacteria [Shimwellia blattae]VEC27148.1 Uncharacterized protein conserved in bacteria [Shimwellia blattae]